MCELWANFAKFGNPTPGDQSDILGSVKWEVYERESHRFMELGLELEMNEDQDLMRRMTFWDQILANYGSDNCDTF